MEESNPELESFRQQWRAEVSARTRGEGANRELQSSTVTGQSRSNRRPPAAPRIPSGKVADDYDHVEPQVYHDLSNSEGTGVVEDDNGSKSITEPRSALEYYEKAVDRETQGSLGDSLDLYRKAFKLDHRVDLKYKNKHFPPSYFASKPPNPNPSNAPTTVPDTKHHSLDGPPQTIKELIASFSGLKIEPPQPEIEGSLPLPCPISSLPDEIIVHIFRDVAIQDVASFARLSQVCKRMAYLVATEDQIWKRVCEGSEVGFGAMHYEWQREVLGGPLEEVDDYPSIEELEKESDVPIIDLTKISLKQTITHAMFQEVYSSSWQRMFRSRPRIRFNGCYISTNNYIRPGQASASQVTWNSPVHIVTYYRYLRFFRDGTVISLLTTTEPVDVVHHLTKELMESHRHHAQAYLPSAVMQHALRGRWRLSSVKDNPDFDLADAEGDLCVETEGTNTKYMYRMDLSLRSAGKGAKNNKLAWAGFWSYNKLTDDWAEFTRRNEKPLFWSRVKSYKDGA